MKQYHDLLNRILIEGDWQDNRTGIRALRIDGHMLQFNMSDGFPAITTKKLAFNAVKGELVGFIRGCNNAEQFRQLGCKVWDQNANENQQWLDNENRQGADDLGRIYGVQWRSWQTYQGYTVDQLDNAVNEVISNPTSRRIIVNAWNPGELGMMALPPCHMMFQLLVNVAKNELSLVMYQRSCDTFLGIPFNIASYALLLHLIAAATGRKPGRLTMMLADVHIYENHLEQVEEQLKREPYRLPGLVVPTPDEMFARTAMEYLEAIHPENIHLVGYNHHPALKGAMAV